MVCDLRRIQVFRPLFPSLEHIADTGLERMRFIDRFEGKAKASCRLGLFPLIAKHERKLDVGFGQVGHDPQGFVVVLDGFVQAAPAC